MRQKVTTGTIVGRLRHTPIVNPKTMHHLNPDANEIKFSSRIQPTFSCLHSFCFSGCFTDLFSQQISTEPLLCVRFAIYSLSSKKLTTLLDFIFYPKIKGVIRWRKVSTIHTTLLMGAQDVIEFFAVLTLLCLWEYLSVLY